MADEQHDNELVGRHFVNVSVSILDDDNEVMEIIAPETVVVEVVGGPPPTYARLSFDYQGRSHVAKVLISKLMAHRNGMPMQREATIPDVFRELNRSELSTLGANVLLQVNVDPYSRGFADAKEGKQSLVRLDTNVSVMERFMAKAGRNEKSVVSYLGSTGVGKSTLLSIAHLQHLPSSRRPLVAKPGQQAQSTTAHVSIFDGRVIDGDEAISVHVLDFEGDDCEELPTMLVPGGLRQAQRFIADQVSCETTRLLQARLTEATKERAKVTAEILPRVSYIVSDVIVFVEEHEPRRKSLRDHILKFAELANRACASTAQQPALIVVHNKAGGSDCEQGFDITDGHPKLTEHLGTMFSKVTILRIPHAEACNSTMFDAACRQLHKSILTSTQHVLEQRQSNHALYSEIEWWFLFNRFVQHVRVTGLDKQLRSFQELYSTESGKFMHDLESNALSTARCFEVDTEDSNFGQNNTSVFYGHVTEALELYAYATAMESKLAAQGRNLDKLILKRHSEILKQCYQWCQCASTCQAQIGNEVRHVRCTQRFQGHTQGHKNPMQVPVGPNKNWFMWLVTLGQSKEYGELIWRNPTGFVRECSPPKEHAIAHFQQLVKSYSDMPAQEYLKALPPAVSEKLRKHSVRGVQSSRCMLCTRQDVHLVTLPNPLCRHRICDICFRYRINLGGDQSVVCPFCHKSSQAYSTSPTSDCGLRVLSLDGGGVRGIVTLRILQRLEEIFSPLTIGDLFDVIVGSSVGGIIAMGILGGKTFHELASLLSSMAKEILDEKGIWGKLLATLSNIPACNSTKLEQLLEELFGTAETSDRLNSPPYVFCTVYDLKKEETFLIGNYDHHGQTVGDKAWLTQRNQMMMEGKIEKYVWKCSLATAARATSAAPVFFEPVATSLTYNTGETTLHEAASAWVDGGFQANCPVKQALTIARTILLDTNTVTASGVEDIEVLVSIGTGLPSGIYSGESNDALSWLFKAAKELTDSEKLWEKGVESLKSLPKTRVNPPHLGDHNGFTSKSIPMLEEGVQKYLLSPNGEETIDKVTNQLFAKLWEVRMTPEEAGGVGQKVGNVFTDTKTRMDIVLIDRQVRFSELNVQQLLSVISARGGDTPSGVEKRELCVSAWKCYMSQPLAKPLQGDFFYQLGGEEWIKIVERNFILEISETVANAYRSEQDNLNITMSLDVVWKSASGISTSVMGFPRQIRVVVSQ